MATITVQSTRDDGRVAFFDQDKAHPNGQVFVRGDRKPVEVGDTPAVQRAIRQGRVEKVQVTPVTEQTPPTKPTSGQKPNGGEQTPPTKTAPWEGYDDLKAEDVVARLKDLDDAGRANVLAYEKAKGDRGRKSVIEPLVNWNS